MIDERPEALLKSALEKIVYFEARSEQLQNDLTAARGETERLKRELSTAAQREIELRRTMAELEVRISRGHQEREELGRVNDALRVERTDLLEKLIEASRIDAAGRENMADMFDLAGFIAQLRGEVINDVAATAAEKSKRAAEASAAQRLKAEPARANERGSEGRTNAGDFDSDDSGSGANGQQNGHGNGANGAHDTCASATGGSSAGWGAASGAPFSPGGRAASHELATVGARAAPQMGRSGGAVSAHAERLFAQGRLSVSESQMMALSSRTGVTARTEETLFGFSVRELAAPDPAARIRAAERLKSLQNPAAAHALATAIHGERAPEVQVAFISAFTSLAQSEGASIVTPLLSSPMPEVRISALRSLLTLDPVSAGPHLSAAMKDPNRAVRRRASLLALSLSGEAALRLGEEAIRDEDAEVRGLAALVLGAGGGEKARVLLLGALRDRELKVRQSAARALSRMLGTDLSNVVNLEDAQRRREVRRLATVPLRPVLAESKKRTLDQHPTTNGLESLRDEIKRRVEPDATPVDAVSEDEPAPAFAEPSCDEGPAHPNGAPLPAKVPEAPRAFEEALCDQLVLEVRSAIRGRTIVELTSAISRPAEVIEEACDLLVARGQLLRRGLKYFFA
ncbi:MAG: HEAT repeat domain-containing protein [Myxococcaceae bacterium]